MENGSPTNGFEDGTIDVDCLLVEPQDGHASMDSVMCFNEKIPENAMDMKDVSCSFGGTNTGIAQEEDDILNRDVLDSMCSEVEDGYFRLHNDFCTMGEEYLLGFEFAESITNLDYISREGMQTTSVADNPALGSCLDIDDTPWKSDLFSIMEAPISHNKSETLADDKPLKSPTSRTSQGIDKFHDISSCSFGDILPNENDTSLSPSVKILCNPKNEKNDEFSLTGPHKFNKQDTLPKNSSRAYSTQALPTQKRSRKPTQRYIDELADPISRNSKKRRDLSTSTLKDKSLGVQDHKKSHMGSQTVLLPSEESSIIPIQVPFGSLARKECPNLPTCDIKQVQSSDRGNQTIKLKENQKRRDDYTTAVNLKKRDDSVTAASPKKREGDVIAAHLRKGDRQTIPSQKKRDGYNPTVDSPEEVSGRRKHHVLWTTAEVRKLIDGVSEHGVGRWSRIKKLLFSSSAHRTSVDLKDKWRNLLKASGMQGHGSLKVGERRKNLAWRPLPKSILRRVRELANMHPYPKGRKHKIAHSSHESADTSTDITLSDYRRILRSINDD